MKVLVTGGTGFIGRALCSALLARGDRVTVLSRNPGDANLPDGVAVVDHLGAIDSAEAVVNLAGENLADGRWTLARKEAFRDSRIGTTRALVDRLAAWPRRPSVLVSGSAIGWYGSRGDELLDESAPPGSGFAAALCRDWEAESLLAEAAELRLCRLRIGVVLHPDGGALARMLPAFRLGLGGRLGDGRQWMSWIRRDDLVRLILWLLDTESARGVYNGTAPAPERNADFTAALAATLHRPALLPMPAPVLRTMFGEMADLLLGSQRVLPARALAGGFRFRAPELAPALHELLG